MKNQTLIRIIDDEKEVRESLALMLDIEGYATATYECARDFLRSDDQYQPGCVLLDMQMPTMNGLQLQEILRQRKIKLPIIFITGYSDIQVAIDALKNGAMDFLLKPVDPEKLLLAINKALEQNALQQKGFSSQEKLWELLDGLSEREKRLLHVFVQEVKDREVAQRYQLSERTVQGHRAKIYQKLSIHSAKRLKELRSWIEAWFAQTH